ncbi:uncharacterized protein LOC110942633 [Helianthus annuus]|uniref:uncharacterized protein LOC110942633 n=1 Tax=Helianthus annuus TaxID=4232 RepID=UPI000B8FC331|nr:uncharacterized protein LOC110942633 [Helianthus annuus]
MTQRRQRNNCYCRRITHEEVRMALRKMGRGKAVGLDNILIEVWKCLGEEGVRWLTFLFNLIFKTGKMPDQWRSSVVVPLYKNKGDVQCCGSYRGIKLLSHTIKLWERIIETRIRRETQVSINQFGFMKGGSTTEAIHILRRLMEKYRARNGLADDDNTQITIEDQLVPQAGWCRWRASRGVLCDRRFPSKLKGNFYRVAIRPAMLYGTDCWAIKKRQARKMEVAEMRMLGWMCGNTRLDRIRNVVFMERLGVASISHKIKVGRLRWFGHVKRRETTAPVRVVENLTVEGKRGRGRPKLAWDEQIRHDLLELHLYEDMVQ